MNCSLLAPGPTNQNNTPDDGPHDQPHPRPDPAPPPTDLAAHHKTSRKTFPLPAEGSCSNPERRANFSRRTRSSAISTPFPAIDTRATLNKRVRESLEIFSEEFDNRHAWGALRSGANRSTQQLTRDAEN
jgi:hypothetical protein